MGLIEVEPGVALHVQDLGTGPAVLLIAGFGLSHQAWDGEVTALLEADNRVVCIDLRGTGASAKPRDGYDFDTLAADLKTVVASLDLSDVTLVGWSFGGQLAFRLAADCPERVTRLMLVGSNAVRASRSDGFPFGPPGEKLLASLTEGERRDRLSSRRRTLIAGFATPPTDEDVNFLMNIWLDMPPWAAIPCYRSYLMTDLSPLVDRVRMPVLQIVGDADPIAPLDAQRWLQAHLPDSRLQTLSACGHYPMLEAPGELAEAMLSFAAGAESR